MCLMGFLTAAVGAEEAVRPKTAQDLFEAGVEAFMEGKMDASLQAFDALVEQEPRALPQLWQRGLALYYAGRFQEGREQFEVHQTVNGQDVENAAWHFLCVTKLEGVETARKGLIPIAGDTRVPMKEIHALYAGRGSEEAVLAAAGENRNHRCYAHLYLGLYYEVLGKTELAREHILKAAVEDSMDHYMGKVAQVHAKLRGWSP